MAQGGSRDNRDRRRRAPAINERFAPIRARRAALAGDRGYVRQILRDGCERASAIADATLAEVRNVMGMNY